MDSLFKKMVETEFVWLPEKGMGYFPVQASPYDEEYFEKYASYANTPMGLKLTEGRIKFVNNHYSGNMVDVGIGCGSFVSSRPAFFTGTFSSFTYGFDINPAGVKWLKDRKLFFDPSKDKIEAASFWDSLEHIHDPDTILNNITTWAFVSMPIYRDADHVLKSKHFKKDEHCWYFTNEGLVAWMNSKGFECVEISHFESILGREDILSYAFKRKTSGA